jgi:hypothetical protein
MGSTTPHGLPFPVGTDRVMDGDNAIEALARAADTGIWGARTQQGTFSIAGIAASGGSTTIAVTFPTPFTATPAANVIAGSGRLNHWVGALSATAVTFGFDNFTPATSGSTTGRWTAVGPM